MCGISLIIDKLDRPVPKEQIMVMNDKVKHRGPDGEGYHYGQNFAMGHRRLSIIDLSNAGIQPFRRGEDYIIFNGMIYNYLELKKELIQLGYEFYTQTDTEVLLVACQCWGIKAFKRLNGMWAFAWYRAKSNDIVLCRDYFGIKPMYYTASREYFAAASEIKQFLGLPGFNPVLNKKSAVNFLVKGWLNYSEQTFFKEVKELRGGHYMIYDLKKHQQQVHTWYDLSKASAPIHKGMQESIGDFQRLFGDSIKKRMRADVNIGSCLSGGLDSSTIVSYLYAHKLTNKNFATVTSCYKDPQYDEQVYSDEVTRVTGYNAYKVFPDLNNLLDSGELDTMLYHQDQPFGTASHYSEFQVFKTAAENRLTVMLDGQGADEYLCGYDDFFTIHIKQLLKSKKFREAWTNLKVKGTNRPSAIYNLIIAHFKSICWYPFISRIKKMLGKTNYPWLNNSWKKLADQYLVNFKGENLRDLSLQQMIFSSLPLQLHSEDRNSMMFSIESRLPFLDHRLVEFVVSLSEGFKIQNGISKFILREAMNEVPALIKQRTDKMGFVAPEEPWVRKNHHRFRKEIRDAINSTDIFSPALLKRFDNFIEGKLNYEPIYFRAVALNRFMKIFKMQAQSAVDNKASIQKILVR